MLKFCRSSLFCHFLRMLIVFNILITYSYRSYAMGELRSTGPSIKSQVAKILLSSLGGAVLGISTLSFYDRPQDHLSNVAIGGVIGVVLGSVYVTRESLESQVNPISSFEDGGTFNLALTPNQNNYQIQWSFAF